MTQELLVNNLLHAGVRADQLECLQHNPAFARRIAEAIDESYDRFCGCYQAAHNRFCEALVTPVEVEHRLGLHFNGARARYAEVLGSSLSGLVGDRILIPGPPEPLSLREVIALWPKNGHDPLANWVASSSLEQAERVNPGWLVARPGAITDSLWRLRPECDQLLQENEVVPNTVELVWMGLVSLSTQGRELTRSQVRSSTSLSHGVEAFVTVGKHGPYMYACLDDRHDDVGLLPIRRIPL